MLVKLTCTDKAHIFRQTNADSGIWGDCKFVLNQDVQECDGWVVFEGLSRHEKTICDPNKTVFITAEPPSVRGYDERFLSQFAVVVTPQQDVNHPYIVNQHPANHWYAGIRFTGNDVRTPVLNYNDFKAMDTIPKTKELSVICSNKTMTSGHTQRLDFLERVVSHFGSSIDVFGGNYGHIEDKWEALSPYKYTIVMENSQFKHYWTEKVSDAFLAATFPFYWGCPNLGDYFPCESFQSIDFEHPEEAITIISNSLALNTYDVALPFIRHSRELVLDRHNLFPVVTTLLHQISSSQPSSVCIRPEEHFTISPARRFKRVVKNWLQHNYDHSLTRIQRDHV